MTKLTYPGSIHNHTQYSNIRLRDCINKEKDLINYAIQLGHKCIAITDHESISSWVKVEKVAKEVKKEHPDFKVIRGNEIYLCRNGLNATNYNKDTDRYYHFILLAKDLVGARQIMEISTRAWKRSYMARGMRRVPTYYQDLIDIIATNPGHVIGSTACLGGALATQILRGTSDDKLELWITQMDQLFGHGNFYLEMQPSHNKEQILVNKKLYEFGHKFQIPYIITTDSHYLKKEDRAIHKAYLNAQNGDREVDEFYATTYMMDTQELESYFPYFEKADLAHAYESIEQIAQSCEDFSLQKSLKIPDLKWKNWPRNLADLDKYMVVIPALAKFNESGYVSDNALVWAVINGINEHTDLQNQRAYDEINENLEMTWVSSEVNKARWSAYYLNLQQIIELCWEAGSLVGPGRGSGVGFILLYVLGITQINPLRETTKCFAWRFLNPERVSVLDVDFDIEGGRRAAVLNKFREFYGEDYVANVATFRTEKSKSAILTAARGLGIDVDIAQYLASLIPADRGQLRTLDQCMYGDEENGWEPIRQFVYEINNNYQDLWKVAHSIEGLICGSGIHAGGVIFVDEPFTNSTGLMRAPDGTICTQFELHDCEDVSLIKYDALSVEAMDKIHNCIDLLCDYGYAKRGINLRETYEQIVGIYNLERDDIEMWKMVWEHKIASLFQMEKQSGIQGIALTKPKSVNDLAVLNSVIRLMAPEKGAEQPLNMWARYRLNINQWIQEMRDYGLSEDEIQWLSHHSAITNGICESQEGLMSLVQEDRLGGNSLTFADKCRKALAKKIGSLFEECEQSYYQTIEEKGCSKVLAHYVWDVLLRVQRGYSFNRSHCLAYSLIALQEMNLAYKYPIMFWNCACLISDAGGNETATDEEEVQIIEEMNYDSTVEEFVENDDEDDDEDEDEEVKSTTKKKKTKATNYGKIAAAIGRIKTSGVTISSPDINNSTYTFSPDIEHNQIRFGLSGITRIGEDLIKDIMAQRPYTSINDFLTKVKVNKPQMINLLKAGAFDEFGNRLDLMHQYVNLISDTKKRITLQNMKMLIDFKLLPNEFDFVSRVYNFNKYLKKFKNGLFYDLDQIAVTFYSTYFDTDLLEPNDTGYMIKQTSWDKIYQSNMDKVRPYIKAHQQELLDQVNNTLTRGVWEKYCLGSISKWEMDSLSCYIHDHELRNLRQTEQMEEFYHLPEQPIIERFIPIKGKQVPIYSLNRIYGTVLDRDKNKKTVTLLTNEGVVTVRIYGNVFAQYDKQISERGADGKKHVIEKSWFSRGNKIIVTGIRQGDNEFLAKKYSRTPYHLVELITTIDDDGQFSTRAERLGENE